MTLVLLPVVVALLVQFASLPVLIGARGVGEAIGWPMIMAIFFAVPSALVYVAMFVAMRATAPPAWLAVSAGIALPAVVVLSLARTRGRPVDLSAKNWVLWMGVIGGLAGTMTYLHLRPGAW